MIGVRRSGRARLGPRSPWWPRLDAGEYIAGPVKRPLPAATVRRTTGTWPPGMVGRPVFRVPGPHRRLAPRRRGSRPPVVAEPVLEAEERPLVQVPARHGNEDRDGREAEPEGD